LEKYHFPSITSLALATTFFQGQRESCIFFHEY